MCWANQFPLKSNCLNARLELIGFSLQLNSGPLDWIVQAACLPVLSAEMLSGGHPRGKLGPGLGDARNPNPPPLPKSAPSWQEMVGCLMINSVTTMMWLAGMLQTYLGSQHHTRHHSLFSVYRCARSVLLASGTCLFHGNCGRACFGLTRTRRDGTLRPTVHEIGGRTCFR